LQGQVNLGGECFDNVVITLGKSAINPQKKQYLGDILLIDGAFNLKTENIEKTKLLEKWLFSSLKEEKKDEKKEDTKKEGYVPPDGAVDVKSLHTSELGKKLLRIHEGCAAVAPKSKRKGGHLYEDSKGYCTFGIGHLIRLGNCTSEDIDTWSTKSWNDVLTDFENDKLPEFEDYVKKHVEKPITQTEFDAMVSFCFNVGEGNASSKPKPGFAGSKFLKEFNKENRNGDLMLNYKDNPNRRKSEVALFNTGKYTSEGKVITNLKIACDGK